MNTKNILHINDLLVKNIYMHKAEIHLISHAPNDIRVVNSIFTILLIIKLNQQEGLKSRY